MQKLTVVMPCYNESATIGEMLSRVLAVSMPGWEKEVIVVDDCSTDGTRDILQTFATQAKIIFREKNGGKGSAVRDGLAEASGDYIVIQDADLEYDPEEIPLLLAPIENAEVDVVYGSRNLRPRERQGALVPRLGVWFLTKLINALWSTHLTDVWTCYKLFPAAAKNDFKAGRFESELLFTTALARRGCRFSEVAISYHPRPASEGKKIRYSDGIIAIILLCLDWLRSSRAQKLTRYLVSGFVGLATNLSMLRLFVELGLYYLVASVCAVAVSMIVGFLMQKFWTFQHRTLQRAHIQFGLYAMLALFNIIANTAIVFFLVEWLAMYYLFAQAIAAAVVAVWSFCLYQWHIFSVDVPNS